MADGRFVSSALKPEAIDDDCKRAALIVTTRAVPRDCAAVVIDRDRLRRQGALMLWQRGSEFTVQPAKPRGFDRPWAPAVPGEGADDSVLVSRPQVARAPDATPAETDLQGDE